ncbi:hypothetical protein PVAG01_01534 [Phlyctema vagabunda]|uniref:Uncharacterized protein n=1 Tax=Phlyctema vagabunda TaxID=108571 RepID=A0ABR4PXD9_9HELO
MRGNNDVVCNVAAAGGPRLDESNEKRSSSLGKIKCEKREHYLRHLLTVLFGSIFFETSREFWTQYFNRIVVPSLQWGGCPVTTVS